MINNRDSTPLKDKILQTLISEIRANNVCLNWTCTLIFQQVSFTIV